MLTNAAPIVVRASSSNALSSLPAVVRRCSLRESSDGSGKESQLSARTLPTQRGASTFRCRQRLRRYIRDMHHSRGFVAGCEEGRVLFAMGTNLFRHHFLLPAENASPVVREKGLPPVGPIGRTCSWSNQPLAHWASLDVRSAFLPGVRMKGSRAPVSTMPDRRS